MTAGRGMIAGMNDDQDFIETPEAQAEAERISLALHDLAHAVRHEPAEVRDHVGAAERITRELRALYERVGEP